MILDRLEAWGRGLTKQEAVAEAQRRHIPAAPVSTSMDLAEDPQLIDRGFLQPLEHPDFGHILYPVGAIASLRGTKIGLAPHLGEQTTDVLTELGYDEAAQQALFEQGVIWAERVCSL
jgi:crotonobetainyl-CoA:carnitine CoA-transferase CaiB-like acyl-CoA transferase